MINRKTSLAASALAMAFGSKNQQVVAAGGTPLADLVDITHNSGFSLTTTTSKEETSITEALSEVAMNTEHCTTSHTEIRSNHDITLDSYITPIAKAVSAHISNAKNVVGPLVIAMAEEVVKNMNNHRPASEDFCIETFDLPKPMQNSAFEAAIAAYKGRPLLAPSKELKLGEMTLGQLIDLLKTGSKQYDQDIAEWMMSKQPDFFFSIWNNLFRDFKVSNPAIIVNIEQFMSGTDATDVALFVHLAARKLYDEVPENTGMTLTDYQTTVAEYRDYSALILGQEYTKYNNSLKGSLLVKSISGSRTKICVNGSIYREWLTKGGTNEVLLGMLTTNDSAYDIETINTQALRFLESWRSYEAYSKSTSKTNAFNRYKEVLTFAFVKLMSTTNEQEKEFIARTPGIVGTMQGYFQKSLNELTLEDLDRVNEVCLKLMCGSRFFYTDAEKILSGINAAVKANPDIDIREAAALSTVEYILDYVADQMVVTS